MGLLNQSQSSYYTGNDYGNYQFVSLQDVINQFMVAYVGEGKIISKASKTDVSFHAQRAMQELSFDTFKSIKSQEIVLPPSLSMILPHDYVNYTCVAWVDDAGIKHILYPTNKTSNPFKIKQDDDGNYDFAGSSGTLPSFLNSSFASVLDSQLDWSATIARIQPVGTLGGGNNANNPNTSTSTTADVFGVQNNKLTAKFNRELFSNNAVPFSRAYSCWQEVDVTGVDELNLEATGFAPQNAGGFTNATIRLGLSSSPGDSVTNPIKNVNPSVNTEITGTVRNYGSGPQAFGPSFIPYPNSPGTSNLAYIQWQGSSGADDSATKQLFDIDVSGYNKLFVLVTMFLETPPDVDVTSTAMTLDDINLTFEGTFPNLQSGGESTTWSKYKSLTPSDSADKYDDGTYDLVEDERYGIDPQYAQVNGSFYIDNLRGLINFSSNVSGKTVVLDYISDSLGTDEEMQVHKFAQEAMYMHIAHAILSTKANIPEYIVRRYKKDRFAATRKAKLRLSNLKLEELTQVLRGKSKWIKH